MESLNCAQLALAVTALFAKDMNRSTIAHLCESTYTSETYDPRQRELIFRRLPLVWLDKEVGILEVVQRTDIGI